MAEPWDDSALINAFNSAIAKYKTMQGISVKGKRLHEDVTENIVNMDSDSQAVAIAKEHDLDQNGPSEKGKNAEEPPHQADKHSAHDGSHKRNSNVKEAHIGDNGDADPQGDKQHHGHAASDENCYLCQWNAYYQQAGVRASPAASFSNRLQCQYCGHVNRVCETGKNQNLNPSPQTCMSHQDSSALPGVVQAAVAEALKTAGGQNSTSSGMANSQAHSNLSDVAVAWFLAGFHTFRYLAQS